MADDQHPSVTIIPTQHLIGIAVGSRDVTVRSRLSSFARLLTAHLNAGGFLRRPRRRLVRLPLIVFLAPSRSSTPYLAACPEFGKLKKRASGRGVAGAGVGRVTSPVNWRACNWEGRASGRLGSEIRSGATWPVTSVEPRVELQGGGSCPLSTDPPYSVGSAATRAHVQWTLLAPLIPTRKPQGAAALVASSRCVRIPVLRGDRLRKDEQIVERIADDELLHTIRLD